MSQTKEDVFLTLAIEAAGEAEAAYYSRQVDQGNPGEPSHSNEVVLEDWYLDDELLTQYVLDWGLVQVCKFNVLDLIFVL